MLILLLIKMGGYGRRVMEIIGSTRKEFLKTGFGLKSISEEDRAHFDAPKNVYVKLLESI
jgi:hypothetical protein